MALLNRLSKREAQTEANAAHYDAIKAAEALAQKIEATIASATLNIEALEVQLGDIALAVSSDELPKDAGDKKLAELTKARHDLTIATAALAPAKAKVAEAQRAASIAARQGQLAITKKFAAKRVAAAAGMTRAVEELRKHWEAFFQANDDLQVWWPRGVMPPASLSFPDTVTAALSQEIARIGGVAHLYGPTQNHPGVPSLPGGRTGQAFVGQPEKLPSLAAAVEAANGVLIDVIQNGERRAEPTPMSAFAPVVGSAAAKLLAQQPSPAPGSEPPKIRMA
jgi:hypothetical protein